MRLLGALLRLLLWIAGLFLVLQVALRVLLKVKPFPIPPQVGELIMESPLRKRFVPASTVVERLGLQPGQTVLEVDAGTGYVAAEAARAVGNEGKVYALDAEPQMIERIRQRALTENLANMEAKLGDAAKLEFGDDAFDVVYFVTSLGEIADKRAALWEAYRVLKAGGTLSITEVAMDPYYTLKGTVIRLCEETGFYLTEEQGNPVAYTENFRKPARRSGVE